MNKNNLPKILETEHVIANIRMCGGCGACIKTCPKNIIARTGGFWHKYIVFVNPEECIGCMQCIEACRKKLIREK